MFASPRLFRLPACGPAPIVGSDLIVAMHDLISIIQYDSPSPDRSALAAAVPDECRPRLEALAVYLETQQFRRVVKVDSQRLHLEGATVKVPGSYRG